MSTLVICLVVAGTAFAAVTKLVTDESAKPATDGDPNDRGTSTTVETSDVRPPTTLRRIRSAIWLVVLLTFVGALAALTVGALVLLVIGSLRHAVG